MSPPLKVTIRSTSFVILVLWLTLLLLLTSRSQSRLELLHADVSRGRVLQGLPVKILEGNVHARQDTIEIFCDRAEYYETEKRIVLTGNILLKRGSETLTARKITYFEDGKKAIAEKEVHLERPGQEMSADWLEYYYKTDQAFARGNLLLHDVEQRVWVAARQGEYLPDEERAYVQHGAHLWRLDSAGTDTLHIYAHLMEYRFSPPRQAIARDSVRIVRGELQATCDSAIYLVDEEHAFLEINPIARQENSQISGAEMEMIFKDMELQQIRVKDQALAVSVEDSAQGKENRLSGREIIMFITDRKISELRAISNASSLYYLKENGEGRGMNTATADTIKVYFTNGELDSIAVKGGAQGIYYPEGYRGSIKGVQ